MKLELLEKQHNKIHSNNARGDTGLGNAEQLEPCRGEIWVAAGFNPVQNEI